MATAERVAQQHAPALTDTSGEYLTKVLLGFASGFLHAIPQSQSEKNNDLQKKSDE